MSPTSIKTNYFQSHLSSPFRQSLGLYSTRRRKYTYHDTMKHTPNRILQITIYTLIIVLISCTIAEAQATSEESTTNKKVEVEEPNVKEEPPAPKPKDKLWKRILKELFRDRNEKNDDDPLEKDPKFLVWKILLKIFILTGLYTTYRRLPDNYKDIYFWYASVYASYLIVTLVLWLFKCYEAFAEYMSQKV